MHSTRQRKDELQAESNRMLWSPIIYLKDEQPDGSGQEAVRAWDASTRELVMHYVESDWRRVWAGRPRTGEDVWFCWLAAGLKLDLSDALPCTLLRTSGALLLTGRSAEGQTRHSDLVFSYGRLSEHFSIVSGRKSAHRYVTPG